ncbi:RpiR family transcriptional regulator [Gammaproteobacteria bacterium]|nr:RpiR family transcriptional regulator [Gammaproteobacteria bacterium]
MTMQFDILYHIKASLNQLNQTERKVAEAILADVTWVTHHTISELADKALVSIAAVSRFAKAIGCQDVRDLRIKLAQASVVGAHYLDADQNSPVTTSSFADVFDSIDSALRLNLASFDQADFVAAVDILINSKMTHVFGMGGCSTMLAQEFQFRFVRLGYPINASNDAIMMRIIAATLSKENVLVVLSVSGVSPDLIEAAKIAKLYGTKIIAITLNNSPLAHLADIVLALQINETHFIYKPSSARYVMMLIIDLLAMEFALRMPEQHRESMRRARYALDGYRGPNINLPLGD